MPAALLVTSPSQNASVRRTTVWKRQPMIIARWLHIYLSMVSFGILFFFAITGLTLNHVNWFDHQQTTSQVRGSVDVRMLAEPVQKLELVEQLRTAHGIRGAVKDFRIDERECSVAFKGPGYSADVIVDRKTGRYEAMEMRMGLVAVLNDLHKGRDTGGAWSAVIDASAVLMTLVSLTGLLLIFFLQKKRTSGLLAAFAGAILCYGAYLAFVP